MICNNAKQCMEEVLKSNTTTLNCTKSEKCLEFCDSRSLVKCEEKGIEYYIQNHLPSELEIAKIHVDSHMITSPELKCDYMVIMKTKDTSEVVLVELKGKDYQHAIHQLNKTLDNLSDALTLFHSIHGRIVWRTKKAPKMDADPDILKLRRRFLQHRGDLKVEKSPFEESSSCFLI
ncbi:hypothetical protein QU667_02460 [Selenomonas dianae]|uniref:Uncharacterized protein n=2 Tax=Selenomonas dianae TaxID=135079 RepID=A0ABP3CG69_9FIRM|nr:hypothetical protein [Selenomonas dianae]WLD82858.1 hypothetical protein QU667_02460 [Selenomonas dianae]